MKLYKNTCKLFVFSALFIFNAMPLLAQEKSDNYVMTFKGEKIVIPGDQLRMYGEEFDYKNEKGKWTFVKKSDVKSMKFNDRTFVRVMAEVKIQTTFGAKKTHKYNMLMEIIAYNEKYVITSYFEGYSQSYSYCIYDRNYNEIENEVRVDGKKDSRKYLDEIVKQYFPTCSKLQDKMEENINTKDTIGKDIAMLQCGDLALDLPK